MIAIRYILLGLFCLLTYIAPLSASSSVLSNHAAQILPPEQAFSLFADVSDTNSLQLEWQIAPNHYLYRDRIKISSQNNADFFQYQLPSGEIYSDLSFGEQVIYRDLIKLNLQPNKQLPQDTQIYFTVRYQGCSDSGFCYPPQTQCFQLTTQHHRITNIELINVNALDKKTEPAFTSSENKLTLWFNQLDAHWKWIGFYFFGLMLAFTPCVLPMLPILSGIIAGPALNHDSRKAFRLTLTYVFSIALTYAVAGVVTAKLGASLQGTLQRPLYIALFSMLFIYLGLSQLGYVPLGLPHKVQNHLNSLQQKQASGTYLGAFALGILATLLASPCVSAPLVGVLSLIAQTGDIWFGGVSLFMMGLGMGTLLLVIGSVGSHLLPKAGSWMIGINQVIAIMLFGLSIWMLSRILAPPLILASWGVLCIISAYLLGAFNLKRKGWGPRVGTIILIYGVVLVIGGSRGHTDLISPLNSKFWASQDAPTRNPLFKATVRTLDELNAASTAAQAAGKPLLLDFYATWCISCINMEKYIYTDPAIQNLFSYFYLVKADVTDFNGDAKALMQQYAVIAPPTLLFFSLDGTEQTKQRIIGDVSVLELKQHLETVLK